MTAAAFASVLKQGALTLGLRLDADQQQRLLGHLAMIERCTSLAPP